MQLHIISYNGHLLNDTSYEAYFPPGSVLLSAEGKPRLVERAHFAPKYTYKGRSSRNLPIQIKLLDTVGSQVDTIKHWFDPFDDTGLYQLVVCDALNWNRQWYLEVTPISVPALDGQVITVNLLVPDPIWRSVLPTNDVWSITATGQTRNLATGGNQDAYPTYSLKPTSTKSAGGTVRYRRFAAIRNQTTRPFTDCPYDLFSAAWDTAALVAAGKMQADGSDVHVLVDGKDADHWFVDLNTDHTKLWCNVNLKAKIELTVSGGYDADDEIITLQNTTGNKDGISRLPASGILLWGTERVRFTSVDGLSISAKRGTYDSTAATHLDGSTMYWLEHEIWVVYGDTSLTDYTVSDAKKPIINLSTSSNTSLIYENYTIYDASSSPLPRSGRWSFSFLAPSADPVADAHWPYYESMTVTSPSLQSDSSGKTFSVMGSYFYANSGSFYKTGLYQWGLYDPAGITHISADGYKRVDFGLAYWWNTVQFQESIDGVLWASIFSIAAPGSFGVNTAWSQVAIALANPSPYIRLYLYESGDSWNITFVDVDNTTITRDSNGIPVISLSAETQPYMFDATLTNLNTGHSISISAAIPINDTLEIDTEEHTITHVEWGTADGATVLESTIRWDVLKLRKGPNTLQYDEDNAQGVTLTLNWRDRNS